MKKKNKAGFTLVETLLALLVLGIGVTALFSIFVVGSSSIRRAVGLVDACMVGQMVLEYYCYTGYYSGMAGIPMPPQESYNADYSAYWPDQSDITLTNISSGAITNLYRLQVAIYKNNSQYLADLETYITQY